MEKERSEGHRHGRPTAGMVNSSTLGNKRKMMEVEPEDQQEEPEEPQMVLHRAVPLVCVGTLLRATD